MASGQDQFVLEEAIHEYLTQYLTLNANVINNKSVTISMSIRNYKTGHNEQISSVNIPLNLNPS